VPGCLLRTSFGSSPIVLPRGVPQVQIPFSRFRGPWVPFLITIRDNSERFILPWNQLAVPETKKALAVARPVVV
jgi:hypothetical protein